MNKISVFLLVTGLAFSVWVQAGDVRRSVVKIEVVKITQDLEKPWQTAEEVKGSGSGVVLPGGRILTAAHVVDNASTIKVSLFDAEEKYEAQVEHISHQRDLALLKLTNEAFFQQAEALTLGRMPVLSEKIVTWGYPRGGEQIATTIGHVSRIGFDTYAHSGISNLRVQVDAAVNQGASGGPALIDGKIAGIVFQLVTQANNVGYIIPVPVIEYFLKDAEDGVINEAPRIDIGFQTLENEQLRAHYGLADGQTGALINYVGAKEEGRGIFQRGDVLLSLDGYTVGNDGKISLLSGDRAEIAYVLMSHQLGDEVPLKILRNGEQINRSYTFEYGRSEIRSYHVHTSLYQPDYLVLAGAVLQELSEDYLDNNDDIYGMSWISSAFESAKPSQAGHAKVFIAGWLEHSVMDGYDFAKQYQLLAVNDVPVENLQQLRRLLAELPDAHIRLQVSRGIAGEENLLIFKRSDLIESEAEIAKKYNLPISRTSSAIFERSVAAIE